jgi:hypothetical protein
MLALLLGCSGNNPAGHDTGTVRIQAAVSGFSVAGNVDTVGLRVSGDDFQPIVLNSGFLDGVAIFELELPYGTERLFEMWASAGDGTILFAGDTITDVIAGVQTAVDILLEPQVTMLRIAPAFRELSLNEPETLTVMIHHADSVFGIAFGLRYDPDIISIAYNTFDVKQGAFFDTTDIFFHHRDSTELTERFFAFSLLGDGEPQGLSGTGDLVHLIYTAKAPGFTVIEFLDFEDHRPMMVNWRGESLPRTGRLYIEPGEVRVID